jgi:trimethylamine:corrinoid methyltransferase-like protein
MEKTVVDAEMIRQWAQSLKPFDVSDEALAVDAIKSVEPGGHFFGTGHTLERFERAFYAPMISDWRNFETWYEDGAKTATSAPIPFGNKCLKLTRSHRSAMLPTRHSRPSWRAARKS